MNIAFLYYSEIIPERGGVQRVSSVLADFLEKKGYNLYYLALHKIDNNAFLSARQFFFPSSELERNKVFLNDFIENNKIEIIINQSGIRPDVSIYAYHAKKCGVKVISVINNSILSGIVNFKSLYKSSFKKYKLQWLLPFTDLPFIKFVLLKLYKRKYASHYQNLCLYSDRVIQLSGNFRKELDFMKAGVGSEKILSIPNPVSFVPEFIDIRSKKKQLLFVGRIDTVYKRVDLLLDIWEKLYKKFPDWELLIVGGGDALNKIIKLSKEKKIERAFFKGFMDPRKYFKDASIFCMTSSSESFGIVLIEAMNYGTVPFAFKSYESVTDIIDHEKNGILIPPFDCNKYALELSKLMNDQEYFMNLSIAAVEKSKLFSIQEIGRRWNDLFMELKK